MSRAESLELLGSLSDRIEEINSKLNDLEIERRDLSSERADLRYTVKELCDGIMSL